MFITHPKVLKTCFLYMDMMIDLLCAGLGVDIEGGASSAVQKEWTTAGTGVSNLVSSTAALDEGLGVVRVLEQTSWVMGAFAVTWV